MIRAARQSTSITRFMSAICGYIGTGDAMLLTRMLDAVSYRGDRSDTAITDGAGFGYRWWTGRPGKAEGVHRSGESLSAVAGAFVPRLPGHASPAVALAGVLADADRLAALDGNFGAAHWDARQRRLTLVRDPFGVRSLYYVVHAGTFYFASELKQLLQIPGLPVEPDWLALHKYLSFSFVPGEDVPIRSIKRVLPGQLAHWQHGAFNSTPYFVLREDIDPALHSQADAVRLIRTLCRDAVRKRWHGEAEVGLYLSGGIDSSAVGAWLQQAGATVRAYSLDFGQKSVEREQARLVADSLGIGLTFVPVRGEDIAPLLNDLVWKLDLPFGDPVTGPQYLLGQAARADGLSCVFNGEGGDQLFGGWTSKPMVAAQLYAGLHSADSREQQYLKSYHRFYGLEDRLYSERFKDLVGSPGTRRAVLAPYLTSDRAKTFLNRIRLADIALKGSQNILPRMDRTAQCWGLDVRAPLFDRALAEASFKLPPALKLHGATEKYVLKLALQKELPQQVVWRRKFGMGVPITDWVLGPLAAKVEQLLNRESLQARGLFNVEYVSALRAGHDLPDEIRRRRLGERLWTLTMLEAWLRIFVDGRGAKPGTHE